jgi:hypothetical protein
MPPACQTQNLAIHLRQGEIEVWSYVIRASSLIRHSSFGFRHLNREARRTKHEQKQEQE